MTTRRRLAWCALGLFLLVGFGAGDASPSALQASAMLAPHIPRHGWAQVLTVTPKWIVLQNVTDGRQYPVPVSAIRLFLIRWPTRLDRVAADSLVEVNGMETPSNGIETPHIDIYQGAAKELVAPMYVTAGMEQIAPNLGLQTNLLFNMFQPIQGVGVSPLMVNPHAWVHLVGPIANLAPLRIGTGNNNFVTVNIGPQTTMTTITIGTPAQLRRGDLAYFLAESAAPKGLVLSQLIVEKSEPMP